MRRTGEADEAEGGTHEVGEADQKALFLSQQDIEARCLIWSGAGQHLNSQVTMDLAKCKMPRVAMASRSSLARAGVIQITGHAADVDWPRNTC